MQFGEWQVSYGLLIGISMDKDERIIIGQS